MVDSIDPPPPSGIFDQATIDRMLGYDGADLLGDDTEAQAEARRLRDALYDIWDQCNEADGICVDGVVEAIQKHAPDFLELLVLGPQVNEEQEP